MKRSLLAVALMMALTSCTTNSSKTLVAYFSATGTTKAVAETIAEKTSADLSARYPSITFVNAGTLNKPSKDDIEAAVSKR